MSSKTLSECMRYLLKYNLLSTEIHPLATSLLQTLTKEEKERYQLTLRDIPLVCWQRCFALASAISLIHVSVGSGDGAIERMLQSLISLSQIICVDPFPSCFTGLPDMIFSPPQYPYVHTLIEDNGNIVGECNLMVIFPEPGCFYCLKECCTETIHTSNYDVDAILTLKPKTITTYTCLNGTAGTDALRFWMIANEQYQKVYSCESYGLTDPSLTYECIIRPVLMFWIRKDLLHHRAILNAFQNLPTTFYQEKDLLNVLKALPVNTKDLSLFDKLVVDTAAEKEKQLNKDKYPSCSSSDQGFFFKFE